MREEKQSGCIHIEKEILTNITRKYGKSISRSLHVTGASGAANIFVGLAKLGVGLLSMSLFTCVSAFYTFGMVVAKYCALRGIFKTQNIKAQYQYYTLSGIVLTIASILYIAYSVRLFYYPSTIVYTKNVAILIALFTFTEIGLNIRGVITTRQKSDPLIHAIKMINLASSLICIVLTQTAILSFASKEVDAQPAANGLIGVIMGSLATLIGIYMIIRTMIIKKRKKYVSTFHKVKKLMKEEEISIKLKPFFYEETEDGVILLYVRCKRNEPLETFYLLQKKAELQLNIFLVDATMSLTGNYNLIGGQNDD